MAATDHFGSSATARGRRGATKSATTLGAFSSFGRQVRSKAAAYNRALQIARMNAVLADLSDNQLAQVGITRSEINQYAISLISNDVGSARGGHSDKTN